MDVMMQPGFLDRVYQASNRLWDEMGAVVDANPHVYQLRRGAGLMQGVMITEPHTCGEIVARLRDEHHLLTVPAGQNVIRLLPPLIVSDAEIDQAVAAFAAVAAALKV